MKSKWFWIVAAIAVAGYFLWTQGMPVSIKTSSEGSGIDPFARFVFQCDKDSGILLPCQDATPACEDDCHEKFFKRPNDRDDCVAHCKRLASQCADVNLWLNDAPKWLTPFIFDDVIVVPQVEWLVKCYYSCGFVSKNDAGQDVCLHPSHESPNPTHLRSLGEFALDVIADSWVRNLNPVGSEAEVTVEFSFNNNVRDAMALMQHHYFFPAENALRRLRIYCDGGDARTARACRITAFNPLDRPNAWQVLAVCNRPWNSYRLFLGLDVGSGIIPIRYATRYADPEWARPDLAATAGLSFDETSCLRVAGSASDKFAVVSTFVLAGPGATTILKDYYFDTGGGQKPHFAFQVQDADSSSSSLCDDISVVDRSQTDSWRLSARCEVPSAWGSYRICLAWVEGDQLTVVRCVGTYSECK